MAGGFRSAVLGVVVVLTSMTGLAAARIDLTAQPPVQLVHGKGGDDHPHLSAAAHSLVKAREELSGADSDFGGHRSQAIAFVDQALEEIRLGYSYGGASHPGPIAPQ